jgi:hypothetical protein
LACNKWLDQLKHLGRLLDHDTVSGVLDLSILAPGTLA